MDIETLTRLKAGHQQSCIVQDYQTLVSVISSVLGGPSEQGSSNSAPAVPMGAVQPKTTTEMTNAFNAVFGRG